MDRSRYFQREASYHHRSVTTADDIRRGDPAALARLAASVLRLRADNFVSRPWAGTGMAAWKAPCGVATPAQSGECFELAAHRDPEVARNPSTVVFADGSQLTLPEVLAVAGTRLLGAAFARFGCDLPVLPKTLSVGELLSVQAHPRGGAELYIVLEADADASLFVGVKHPGALREAAISWRAGLTAQATLGQLAAHEQSEVSRWLAQGATRPQLALASAPQHALAALARAYDATFEALCEVPVAAGSILFNANAAHCDDSGYPSAHVHCLGNREHRELLIFEVRRPGPTLRMWDHARFPMRSIDLDGALAACADVPAGDLRVVPVLHSGNSEQLLTTSLFAVARHTVQRASAFVLPLPQDFTSLHVLAGELVLETNHQATRWQRGESGLIPNEVKTIRVHATSDTAQFLTIHMSADLRGA